MTDSTQAGPATFGEFLKFLRRRMQMTQQELGSALGYSTAMIARLENGERLPDLALVKTTYIEALGLEHEPQLAARLVELAAAARREANVPVPHPPVRHTNLPAQPTRFIGRKQDIASALQFLRRRDVRLITLLGPPGVGKTRLLIEVARVAGDDFRDGVCLVPLAPVADPALVASTVAQALGVGATQVDPLVGVKLHLRDKHLLLVLDNLEHLLEAAPLIAEVLEAAPHMKVLTTSRSALRLSAEFIFEVPPLDEPTAVELFAVRAGAVQPDFTLTAGNRAVVTAICRRLDGLPLAIELAAARLWLFSPQALLTRLARGEATTHSSLDMLAEGPRDLPARQRTLRSTIAWSYALLTTDQQRLLRHLSVFPGSCSLDAAQAVAGAPATFEADLQALLDSSLVQHREGPDGEPRLSLLWMIREFAAEQLAACGEGEEAQHQHATFYRSLVTRAPGMLILREGMQHYKVSLAWLSQMELEYDNLHAALAWSLGRARDTDTGTELALWLFELWGFHFPWHEAVYFLERALALAEVSARSQVRARLLITLARFVGAVRDSARAVEAAREALATFKSIDDKPGIEVALWILTEVDVERNDLVEAQAVGEEWLAVMRESHDHASIGNCLLHLADLALCQKDFRRSKALLEEILTMNGNSSFTLNLRGVLACYESDYERATALCEESLAGMRAMHFTHGVATVLHSLGDIALFRGDEGEARLCFAEGLQLFGENGNKQRAVWCLSGLAAACAVGGQAALAVTLWSAAQAIYAAIGSPRPALRIDDYRERVTEAKGQLDPRDLAAASAAGHSMNFEQAIAYALSE